MVVRNDRKVVFCFVALCCAMLLSGCKREANDFVARWVHYRVLDESETNGVRMVVTTDANLVNDINEQIISAMSVAERDESRIRVSNVLSELEGFSTSARIKRLADEFTSVNEEFGCGREEVVMAFESVKYTVLYGMAPVVVVETRSSQEKLALASLEFWAAAFQAYVYGGYKHKCELTTKWIEAECKNAEMSGCRDVEIVRQCYMTRLAGLNRTLRQLRFYTVEAPHIVHDFQWCCRWLVLRIGGRTRSCGGDDKAEMKLEVGKLAR